MILKIVFIGAGAVCIFFCGLSFLLYFAVPRDDKNRMRALADLWLEFLAFIVGTGFEYLGFWFL